VDAALVFTGPIIFGTIENWELGIKNDGMQLSKLRGHSMLWTNWLERSELCDNYYILCSVCCTLYYGGRG
jgi:hypothetical protein